MYLEKVTDSDGQSVVSGPSNNASNGRSEPGRPIAPSSRTCRVPPPLSLDPASSEGQTEAGSCVPLPAVDELDSSSDGNLRRRLEESLGLGGMGANARSPGQSSRSFDEMLQPFFEERRHRQSIGTQAGGSVSKIHHALRLI